MFSDAVTFFKEFIRNPRQLGSVIPSSGFLKRRIIRVAGVANATYVFCLPGSSGACATAWDRLIVHQLDYRTRPCNLVELMPRLLEK